MDEKNELYFSDYATGKIYKFEGTPVTSVKENKQINFSLEQNYPNPFNPSTTIKFALNEKLNVNLKIYDILGKEIAILLDNESKTAGNYEIIFNASGLASGIYIYKLSSPKFSFSKKMILIK